ncbi:MAG TPA: hypothetical protein VLX91_15550 [Candidatus Acidoferrales bacterium]|nr:hypothetical protein [Candidatus Acidoferrales bacterium]
MLIGAHCIIHSKNPDADRAFFKDVLKLSNVDAGDGWLIFALPPSEVAIHPSDKNSIHELYLMCEDVDQFVSEMEKLGILYSPVENRGWGLLTELTLPSGGNLGVYQPHHERPRTDNKRTQRRPVKHLPRKTRIRRK